MSLRPPCCDRKGRRNRRARWKWVSGTAPADARASAQAAEVAKAAIAPHPASTAAATRTPGMRMAVILAAPCRLPPPDSNWWRRPPRARDHRRAPKGEHAVVNAWQAAKIVVARPWRRRRRPASAGCRDRGRALARRRERDRCRHRDLAGAGRARALDERPGRRRLHAGGLADGQAHALDAGMVAPRRPRRPTTLWPAVLPATCSAGRPSSAPQPARPAGSGRAGARRRPAPGP